MTQLATNLAIFDLDYTLTKRGTWGRFVWQMMKPRPHLWVPVIVSAGWAQFRYKRGKLPRVRVKQAMMRWCMVGKSKAEMLAAAEKFADKEVPDGLRPGAITALNQHRENGDNIMIVSAAVDILAEAIAKRLNVAHTLATDMAWDEDGNLRGDFASPNCYGAEKVRRLESYFEQHPQLKQDGTMITMYSDSYSDLDIMQYCDVAVAVNSDKKLTANAEALGFELVDWDK